MPPSRSFDISSTVMWTAAFIMVLVFFQFCYGLEIIVPANISWLMDVRHDWGQHYLGFHFFKNEPWGFPLGKVDGFSYSLHRKRPTGSVLQCCRNPLQVRGNLLPGQDR